MRAYIIGKGVLEVEVKWRAIDECGLVHIKDENGLLYETHISNVIFVSGEGVPCEG